MLVSLPQTVRVQCPVRPEGTRQPGPPNRNVKLHPAWGFLKEIEVKSHQPFHKIYFSASTRNMTVVLYITSELNYIKYIFHLLIN